MMWKQKKGLAASLIVIIFMMFLFAIFSLLALTGWNVANETFQGLDNATVSPETKAEIDGLTSKILFGDRLFVMLYIFLLVSYLISAKTIPSDRPEVLLVFIVFLFIICFIAMGLSNAWSFLISNVELFAEQNEHLPFINHFMRWYPVYTFFVGIAGGFMFYTKRRGEIALTE